MDGGSASCHLGPGKDEARHGVITSSSVLRLDQEGGSLSTMWVTSDEGQD